MKVRIDHVVNVPNGFVCGNCNALTVDYANRDKPIRVCSYFNRFIFMRNGVYVKCRECVDACHEAYLNA